MTYFVPCTCAPEDNKAARAERIAAKSHSASMPSTTANGKNINKTIND
jgi:hypothetical protein